MQRTIKYLIITGLVPFLFFACNKDCMPAGHEFSFSENSSLRIDSLEGNPENSLNATIEGGSDLVFTYTFTGAQCESVFDDEYAEFLHFQIDPEISEFEYQDSALLEINLVFIRGGAWIHHGEMITNGVIKGEKLNAGKWEIEADLQPVFNTHDESMVRSFKEIFKK